MKDLGMNLNSKIYATLMNIYGHIGEVSAVEQIWHRDITDNDIKYNKFVVSAMVDCLARAAQLNRAKEIVLEYEKYSNNVYHESMWGCLLSACYNHCGDANNEENKVVFAEEVYSEMKHRFSHNKKRMKSTSVIMSNIRSLSYQ